MLRSLLPHPTAGSVPLTQGTNLVLHGTSGGKFTPGFGRKTVHERPLPHWVGAPELGPEPQQIHTPIEGRFFYDKRPAEEERKLRIQ